MLSVSVAGACWNMAKATKPSLSFIRALIVEKLIKVIIFIIFILVILLEALSSQRRKSQRVTREMRRRKVAVIGFNYKRTSGWTWVMGLKLSRLEERQTLE